jgi:hypothetical protein
MRPCLFRVALFSLLGSGLAFAQGTQTVVITGKVTSSDGQSLPGVGISVRSPALQGARSAISDATGGYILRALPPGDYTVTFTLTGMGTIEKKVVAELGHTIPVDAVMSVNVQETLTVTGEAPSIVEQTTTGANYRAAEIDKLATGRTLFAIAELSPGVTTRSPDGNLTLAGAFAWDNVFLINGVDVNDNVYGSPSDLFIEDAIEEVQVLTSGISAEYGRFSGGVVNAVTKHGGNTFSGSFRADATNPSWTDENPIEKKSGTQRTDKTNFDYQATLGGPIIKDRLWFFTAGRKSSRTTNGTLVVTETPYVGKLDNDRFEAKLTGTLATNHTLQASYTNNNTTAAGPSLGDYSADFASFNKSSGDKNHLFVANYNGVLRSNLFAEAQYSEKKFRFVGGGGTSLDIVDSPMCTIGYAPQQCYNAPYFDANDPESRDNRQMAASLSYFLSTSKLGRHDLKAGYENFRSTRTGGNSQTSTGYVIYADYLGGNGTPTLDKSGFFEPIFEPGTNYAIQWIATRGARIDITTQSLYLNDRWQINNHFSANLGARVEKVGSEATGNALPTDARTFSPRLALSYDPRGDGRWKLDATYAIYSGKFSEDQFGGNTPVGNPSSAYFLYTGPPGVGRSFAPGFNPANYTEFLGGSSPLANVSYEPHLSSPRTREVTLSVGHVLPKAGYVRATFTDRKVSNFIETFTDTTTGRTNLVLQGNELGVVDDTVYRNTDEPTREFRALELQAAYTLVSQWRVEGSWTRQLRNYGDYEGEGRLTPGVTTLYGDYPEVFFPDRHFPLGRLDDYQRDKIRLWTSYGFGVGHGGKLSLGLLYRYDSPLTGSVTAFNQPYSPVQEAGRALYAAPPPVTSNTLFFGPRGAVEFNGEHNVDLALNYEVPVFKTLRPWFKGEMRNVFNTQTQIGGSTNVQANPRSPLDVHGLPTGYLPLPTFMQAVASSDYQVPRQYRFSIGFRF